MHVDDDNSMHAYVESQLTLYGLKSKQPQFSAVGLVIVLCLFFCSDRFFSTANVKFFQHLSLLF